MKVRSVGVGRVWDCMLCTCVREKGLCFCLLLFDKPRDRDLYMIFSDTLLLNDKPRDRDLYHMYKTYI
jgi:hypothetical protein